MTDVQLIKKTVSPLAYYKSQLSGAFGKATGNGWHAWNGLCPFHADKRVGSFVINQTTGAFKCFSCGANGGDIIDFHMERHGLRFPEALKSLKGVVNG